MASLGDGAGVKAGSMTSVPMQRAAGQVLWSTFSRNMRGL